MFCKNCGKSLEKNVKFCPKCGTAVPEDKTEKGGVQKSQWEINQGVSLAKGSVIDSYKKSKVKTIVIGAVALCVLALAVTALFPGKKKEETGVNAEDIAEEILTNEELRSKYYSIGYKDGKWVVVNLNNETVELENQNIDGNEVEAAIFSEGLMRVKSNNGKWGYINKEGEQVIPIQYDDAWSFFEGLAEVEMNGKWGYINKEGEEVIPIQYDDVTGFSEGLAAVEMNGKWGYINREGKQVIPFQYDRDDWFIWGLAQVELNGKKKCINAKGEELFPCEEYEYLTDFVRYDGVDSVQ